MGKFLKRVVVLLGLIIGIIVLSQNKANELHAQDGTPIGGTIMTDPTGVEMVYVPSGTFQMGIELKNLRNLCSDLYPATNDCDTLVPFFSQEGILDIYSVTIPAFWIDLYEVTAKQFEPFISLCTDQNVCSLDYLERARDTWPSFFDDSNKPQVAIDWYTALRFCNSRGARLPTEEEWEYAASGPENSPFPWGTATNLEDVSEYIAIQSPYAVGSKPLNVSWIGVYDMAGNVAEWVEDRFAPYPGRTEEWTNLQPESSRVYRGGSVGDGLLSSTTFTRYYSVALSVDPAIGFRCARTSEPPAG